MLCNQYLLELSFVSGLYYSRYSTCVVNICHNYLSTYRWEKRMKKYGYIFLVYYVFALSFVHPCRCRVWKCDEFPSVMDICSDFRYCRGILFSVIVDSALLHVPTAFQIRFMPREMSLIATRVCLDFLTKLINCIKHTRKRSMILCVHFSPPPSQD